MTLLLRSGDKAMISDAAAITTLIIATVVGSMELQSRYFNPSDPVPGRVNVFRGRQVFLCGRCGVQLFAPTPD